MPMPLSIYDHTGVTITALKPVIDNHTTLTVNQLLGTSPVHTAATIYRKLEPSIRQSPLEISFYKLSAADMIRQHYHTGHELNQAAAPQLIIEDQHSLSSVSYDSTNSSVSDTTTTLPSGPVMAKSKKQSYRRLLREIRRLRSENANLHNSVNILKEDLRHERESRQIAEQCHKKYFDDSINTHTQLELEIMDQQDQLSMLRTQLDSNSNNTTTSGNTNTSITSYKSPLLFFDDSGDEDDGDNCALWNCEEMDCSTERRCHDSGADGPFSIYHDLQDSDEYDDDDDDDDDQDNGTTTNLGDDDDRFENLAVSYLQQALVANLTSARANLEFDDLTLKYDPSPDRILRTLADAFLVWLRDTIHQSTPFDDDDQATCVAKLITTSVQDVFLQFWKAILERYVHNDEDQYQFLHQFERILHACHQDEASSHICHYIVQNFHRLLVMFYKYDIVGGDAVTTWWHASPPLVAVLESKAVEEDPLVADQLRDVTKKFVEWVDEDDEDEDDDDDDDDDQQLVFGNNSDNSNIDDIDDDDWEDDSDDCDDNDDQHHHLDGFDTSDLLAAPPPPDPAARSSIHPDMKKKSVSFLM